MTQDTMRYVGYRDVELKGDGSVCYGPPRGNWKGYEAMVLAPPGWSGDKVNVVISTRSSGLLEPVQLQRAVPLPCRRLRGDVYVVDFSSADPDILQRMICAWVDFIKESEP